MFRFLQNTLKFSKLKECRPNYKHIKQSECRNYCQSTKLSQNNENFVSFDEVIKNRKSEANKSVLVQVNSENSYQDLIHYCSTFGVIKDAFHYSISEDSSHFILLEYNESYECQEAFKHSQFNEDNPGVPVNSPFLWFKAGLKPKLNEHTNVPVLKTFESKLDEESLKDLLRAAETLDDQMMILFRATCLSDLGIRLRFLAAKQVETSLIGMFPRAQAFPFGSSVNGFGRLGCDLDLILKLNHDYVAKDSRLIFHTKASLSNERSQTQRQMETLGDILHLFLPGVSNVRRILQARVPIIKYNHECLDLEVDLSMSNLTGLYMSELLYLYGELDHRVKPLTFCIRKWANAVGLTNPSPGRWISNFSLTMLVLFFLQHIKKAILPPMSLLINSATTTDIRITDDNINCSFLRDLNKLDFTQNKDNNDMIGYLLMQFFEFYSQFDFTTRAISLIEGKSTLKCDHSAMYIVNPLEPQLNVSKNVSLEELERFRFEVRNAAWVLESSYEKSDDPHWGLLNIFKTNKQAIVRPQMFYKSRLVDVSDLFEETTIPSATPPSPPINFKNDAVKAQVQGIQRATKKELHKIQTASNSRSKIANKRR